MTVSIQSEILVPGSGGTGEALVLSAPISFWGGVDPKTGRIVDVRHPQCGECLAGRVLFLPGTIGSSSASAVLMELVHGGNAPSALVLHEPDAILLLGLIVAREMGWKTPVAVKLDRERFSGLVGTSVTVSADGLLVISSQPPHPASASLGRLLPGGERKSEGPPLASSPLGERVARAKPEPGDGEET